MNFVNLHTHSMYSIRDAVSKIPELVKAAKALKMPGLALTDHGTASGIHTFYKECVDNNIKPILGAELYMAPGSAKIKDPDNRYSHITLLAMNNIGWRNLCTLISFSNLKENFYYRPRIDREALRLHSEGLICLSGCVGAELPKSIVYSHGLNRDDEVINIECADCTVDYKCSKHRVETPEEIISWYKKVFGDRYYIELQNHDIHTETLARYDLIEYAKKYEIKTVATGDTHFVHEEDVVAHNIMLSARNKVPIDSPDFQPYEGTGYYLPNIEYLVKRFSDAPEAIGNTMEIYERCNVTFEYSNLKTPIYYKDVKGEDDYFKQEVIKGLKNRFNNAVPEEYKARIKEEIITILQMGFAGYFLIVADYVNWAKKNNIPIGTGRGSAAGSLVSYSLGITNVDPIKYGLSFSRFLNKGRAAVPQITFNEYPIDEWRRNSKPQS